MDDYISISQLNDFVFCPYSIYLHNVYMNTDEGLYHASPQTKGKIAHTSIDNKSACSHKNEILALPVYSHKYCLMGKIDLYRQDQKSLIERKYRISQIYKGQIYQLWAQYFCMIEMGYEVSQISIYDISANKMHHLDLPSDDDKIEFENFLIKFRYYNPHQSIDINPNKCRHCIYCNLCDKTEEENVY